MNNKDLTLLMKIIKYADEVTAAIDYFGGTFDNVISNVFAKNSILMDLLQIGELVGHMSDETKEKYNGMPWVQIRAIRNMVAHQYEQVSNKILWDTACDDIPALRAYCEQILAENGGLENG